MSALGQKQPLKSNPILASEWLLLGKSGQLQTGQFSEMQGLLSVESRCGAVALGSVLSVAAPFVWRCPSN